MDIRMSLLSRKAVPYTPVDRPLKGLTVALVSTAGVHRKSDEPYNLEGDERFYVFPGEVAAGDLMITHGHYDHADADRDINCVFPIDRLRELAAEGVIAGVSNKHVGMMGFTKKLTYVYEQVVPAMGKEVERSKADAVVLTGGCPFCHRVAAAVQREIESRGLPTIFITLRPEETRLMRPPRAVCPEGFPLGRCLGPPDRPEIQRRVLLDALHQLEELHMPGSIVELSYPEYRALFGAGT
jgi:D-proline reductase (dithiol) PrdB